jgi:homogentisate 1,2-dioxygenase
VPEQVTGTPFFAHRDQHKHSYLYRIRPSVAHPGFIKPLASGPGLIVSDFTSANPAVKVIPDQAAWDPFEVPPASTPTTWVQGLRTVMGAGDARMKNGLAVHVYAANTSMKREAFCTNDGELCIVVQQGRLDIQTELGRLMVHPGEVAVIQRGLRFKVSLPDGPSRGYVQELYMGSYRLPELGPLGGSGLAHQRDFLHPTAFYEEDEGHWEIHYKVLGQLFLATQDHSPFDVVAWHGNYVPYKVGSSPFRNPAGLDRS